MSKPAAYVMALVLTVGFFVSIYFFWKHHLDTSLAPPTLVQQPGQPQP